MDIERGRKGMCGCCFIGHRAFSAEIKKPLVSVLEELIKEKKVTRFYVGTQGKFDRVVYDVLCELEKQYSIQIFVVLAYLNRDGDVYYDGEKTIYPDELAKTPLRYAIRKRNSFMIDKADYLVAYINTPYTNAYGNVLEAIRKKKKIINLGSFQI